MSRLNLDFKLETRDERIKYINEYTKNLKFTPNSDELEMMGKYILWGKVNPTDKPGAARLKVEGIELETRSNVWAPQRTESLDALIESPTFNESTFNQTLQSPVQKVVHEKFSREYARANATPFILNELESLWRTIDLTELLLNFYELKVGKRKNPPRDSLLSTFAPDVIESTRQKAETLTQYKYLKLKHELVELYKQQFMYKDLYAPTIYNQAITPYSESTTPTFDTEIEVLPLGILGNSELSKKIFRSDRFPQPDDFNDAELKEISKLLWRPARTKQKFKVINLGDSEQLYKIYNILNDLEDSARDPYLGVESNLGLFLEVIHCYESLAQLEPSLRDILRLKREKKTNQEIADFINQKYSKNYKPNYISTLYCKKCLVNIAAAALKHKEVIENIFFPENFKKCKDCGEVLLLNEENFVRRHRSNDGFSPRCKKCEKIKRQGG